MSKVIANLLGLHAGEGLVVGTGLEKGGQLSQQGLCQLLAAQVNALMHRA